MTGIESGERLAQAIRIGDLALIAAALEDVDGVTDTDPIGFARHLIACMRGEQAAGSIVDHWTEQAAGSPAARRVDLDPQTVWDFLNERSKKRWSVVPAGVTAYVEYHDGAWPAIQSRSWWLAEGLRDHPDFYQIRASGEFDVDFEIPEDDVTALIAASEARP